MLHVYAAFAATLAAAIPVPTQNSGSTAAIFGGEAEIILRRIRYENWFFALTPRQRQLEYRVQNFYTAEQVRSGGSIAPTEENIRALGEQLGASEDELVFIGDRMRNRYESDRRLLQTRQ